MAWLSWPGRLAPSYCYNRKDKMNAQQRTQQDDYHRLIAVAFEERVNAMARASLLEQQLAGCLARIERMTAAAGALEKKIAETAAQIEHACDSPAAGAEAA